MQLFQIDGFRNIDGSDYPVITVVTEDTESDPAHGDRMPDSREHEKLPMWNDTIHSHVYKTISELLALDTDAVETLISSYDNYLTGVSYPSDNIARLTLKDGEYYDINLPETTTITYPGDTKILFDNNSSLGGDSNFLYDNNTTKLKVSNFTFTGRDTVRGQSSYNTFIQYVGTRSLLLNSHYNKYSQLISTDEFTDNLGLGFASLQSGVNLSNVTAIGNYSAYSLDAVTGGVYIGNYAGSNETNGRRFYIDDEAFASKQLGIESSLLYGEFDNDYLRVNASVYIKNEVRIGDVSDTSTASGGMVKFVDTDDTFVPWYHDGTSWRLWDTAANYYLDTITPGTVSATDEDYLVTFNVNGLSGLTLQLGANAFNSDTINSANGDTTRVQLSTGAAGDYGFTSYAGLTFNSTDSILSVSRGLLLPVTTQDYDNAKVVGTFITAPSLTTGLNHAYAYLRGAWRQLDNEGADDSSTGDNIGDTYEIYAQQSESSDTVLEFRTLTEGDNISLSYTDSTARTSGEITISNLYNVLLDSVDDTSLITPYKATPITSESSTDTLQFRKFKSTDGTVTFSVADDDYIDISANNGSAAVSTDADSVGGGDIDIYAGADSPTLHFKSLTLGDYISATDVSNLITLTAKGVYSSILATGTGTSLIDTNEAVSTEDLTLKTTISKLIGTNGITVSKNTSTLNVEISNDTVIDKSYFLGTEYDNLTSKLSWNVNYYSDIRNTVSYAKTEIGGFIIGTNLSYNETTNTLSADSQSGGTTNPLTDITTNIVYVGDDYSQVDTANSDHEVTFEYQSGYEKDTSIFGYLAFQDIYNDATSNNKGIVNIGDRLTVASGEINVPIATSEVLGVVKIGDTLTIDATGLLGVTSNLQDSVLYDTHQYSLHDEDAYNATETITATNDTYTYAERIIRRNLARANVGAAYVNGATDEDFNADSITATSKFYCNHLTSNSGDAEFGDECSQIEAIIFRGPHVTSTAVNNGIWISKRPSNEVTATSVGVQYGDILMAVNSDQGDGTYTFYKTDDSGSLTKLMKLTSDGDLYLKNKLYIGNNIEGFDTNEDW